MNSFVSPATRNSNSLDRNSGPRKTFTSVLNNKIGQKDTFLNIFPGYGIRPDFQKTCYMLKHSYADWNPEEGHRTIDIDKSFHNKLDEIKIYTEEFLKTSNMRRK